MRFYLVALVFLLPACAKEVAKAPPRKPPSVTVATPEKRDIETFIETSGRTKATARVEVRARVTGFLEEMTYTVGQRAVKKGDVLFVIEKANYIATVDQAKAELQAAQAEELRAASDLERFEKAAKTNAVSQVEVTRARADKMKADAAILKAQANLTKAELDLFYCDVRSPIDGIPSRNLVDVGNLVDAFEKTQLTTVVAISPIFVYFDVPEKYVNEARRNQEERKKAANGSRKILVRVGTPGDDGHPHEGVVDWADNEVNQDTGTLQARAIFPNDTRLLYAGVFVRVQIMDKTETDQVLIEERAIGTDLAGKFVLVVGEGDVVERRGLTLGQREGMLRVVKKGMTGTERYIVVGQLRARPGLPVTVTPAAKKEG